MAITYNRRPNGVPIPSSSDVKQYYFNHYNWKGINQNRNFLAVDQETFSDAKNVYVDTEGLLKSRPGFKFKQKFEGKLLKDIKVFDNLILCTYIGLDGEWYIGIIENDEWIIDYKVFVDYPLKAFKNGNYLYVFTNKGIITYNSETKKIDNTLFYKAITRIYSGLNFNTFENENLASNTNRYQYLLYPTIAGESYVSNSINGNAYGKIGSYTHFINEDKITHKVTIDADKNFLNIIHQPLFTTTDGFFTTNAWNVKVPTWAIRDGQIYRYWDGKIQVASLSDGVFKDLLDVAAIYSNALFVKIKLATSGRVLVLFDTFCYAINSANEVAQVGVDRKKLLDLDELFINGELEYVIIGMASRRIGEDEMAYYLSGMIVQRQNDDFMTVWAQLSPITWNEDSIKNATGVGAITFNSTASANNYIAYTIKVDNYAYYDLLYIPQSYKQMGTSLYGWSVEFNSYNNEYVVGDVASIIGEPSQFVQPFLKIRVEDGFYVGVDVFFYDIENNRIVYGDMKLTRYPPTFENEIWNPFDYNVTYQYSNGVFRIEEDGTVNYILLDQKAELVTNLKGEFLANGDYWMLCLNDRSVTLSNYRLQVEEINVEIDKNPEVVDFDIIIKGDKFYASKNNNFYIGEIVIDPDDDLEKLYFRKDYKHILDENVTGLHLISNSELAIFTPNNVWYNTNADGIYYYNQSKIIPNLKGKSELLTLLDSTTTVMPSTNGVVALSYQNFVNTTEQSTINLTQDLTPIYELFENDIRIVNYKSYTLFYEIDNRNILIYDNRLSSWWRWELPKPISTLYVCNNELRAICDGAIYEFSNSGGYFDKIEDVEQDIDWFIESQKLYLGANNYYKHISNLTLSSVEESDAPISLNLNVKNYRKWVDNGKAENFDYHVDVIRTYVKRVNYAKVCEFQYKLSSNDSAIKSPLALSSITIKYKIGGQVR